MSTSNTNNQTAGALTGGVPAPRRPPYQVRLDRAGVTIPVPGRYGGHWIRLQCIVEMKVLMNVPAANLHDHSGELCILYKDFTSPSFSDGCRLVSIPYEFTPDAQADMEVIAEAIAESTAKL